MPEIEEQAQNLGYTLEVDRHRRFILREIQSNQVKAIVHTELDLRLILDLHTRRAEGHQQPPLTQRQQREIRNILDTRLQNVGYDSNSRLWSYTECLTGRTLYFNNLWDILHLTGLECLVSGVNPPPDRLEDEFFNRR